MIMEYCGGGELLKYVEEKSRLSEVEARNIFVQIVTAMSYCH
jgi:serine/threonine protein kinase